MSQSPVSGKSRKLHDPVLPKKFREEINSIKKSIDDLIVLATHVGHNGSVTATVMVGGKQKQEKFGAQAIKSFKSRINKKLDSFASEYSNTYRSKKSKKSRKSKEGEEKEKLPNLSKISDAFREFWAGANLGPVNLEGYSDDDIKNKSFKAEVSLVSKLPMLTQRGITSSSLLQSAWATYVDANVLKTKVTEGEKERIYLKADKHMKDHLGPALDWLAKNATDKKGKKVAFNADQFERKWLAIIGSFYTIPRPGNKPSPMQEAVGITQAMTDAEQNYLRQDGTRKEVKNEIELLKQVRNEWRAKLGTGKKKSKQKASSSVQESSEEEEQLSDTGSQTGEDVDVRSEEEEEEQLSDTGSQAGEDVDVQSEEEDT